MLPTQFRETDVTSTGGFGIERVAMCLLATLSASGTASAGTPPLLPEPAIVALGNEIDGDRAKRDVEVLAQQHRMRASEQFHRAAEYIAAELRRAGLTDVEVLRFPADGATMFGTQKARPAWDAEFAELWELEWRDQQWQPGTRIASWESMPLSLAQDSDSGEVTADLVDVGAGTREQDYAGKQVRGQLVLASSQPEAVAPFAPYFLAKERQRPSIGRLAGGIRTPPTTWFGDQHSPSPRTSPHHLANKQLASFAGWFGATRPLSFGSAPG